MWDLMKVAFRNVGRNKRRALITSITVFLGVSVILGARGLLNGLQFEFRSALIRKVHGDLQIHHRGYQDSLDSNPYKMLIPYNESTISKIKATPGVTDVTPRLRLMGLLNHQKTQSTTPVVISAFNSKTELQVCPRLKEALQSGLMIDSEKEVMAPSITDDNLEEAVPLQDSTPTESLKSTLGAQAKGHHQILVTPSLLRGMNASIGDEVVLLLQDKDNMQQALIAEISGVIDYALPNSASRMIWMDFKTLQDTLHLEGFTSELAIRASEGTDLESLKVLLQNHLTEDHIVETWLEIGGFFRDVMNLQNAIFSVVIMIVFLIVISAIVNTSLMTVMERTREIGTLMALGYQRVHIIFLFLCESAVIGVLGGLSGILFIGIILIFLSHKGLIFAIPGQTIATILYPSVTIAYSFGVFILSVFAALAASFYPAYRASRMKPVVALSAT